MSVQALLPLTLLVLFMSVIGMIWSVGKGAEGLTFTLAALFPVFVVLVGLGLNLRSSLAADGGHEAAMESATIEASRTNSLLMALVYAWGGLAMFGIYTLTPLWWFHSWQYATAMLVIAAALWIYQSLMGHEGSPLRRPGWMSAAAWASLAQAVAVAGGLMFLLGSSKFYEPGRTDWAANQIFVAGGAALFCLSLIAAAGYWRVSRPELSLASRS